MAKAIWFLRGSRQVCPVSRLSGGLQGNQQCGTGSELEESDDRMEKGNSRTLLTRPSHSPVCTVRTRHARRFAPWEQSQSAPMMASSWWIRASASAASLFLGVPIWRSSVRQGHQDAKVQSLRGPLAGGQTTGLRVDLSRWRASRWHDGRPCQVGATQLCQATGWGNTALCTNLGYQVTERV